MSRLDLQEVSTKRMALKLMANACIRLVKDDTPFTAALYRAIECKDDRLFLARFELVEAELSRLPKDLSESLIYRCQLEVALTPDYIRAEVCHSGTTIPLKASDWSFVIVTVSLLGLIGFLGSKSYVAAHELEALKKSGEAVVHQLEATAKERAEGAADLGGCSRNDVSGQPATWAECLNRMKTAPALQALRNPFVSSNNVFGTTCDRGDPLTKGQIVFEKGTEWFSAGSSGITFSAIDDSEPIGKPLTVRIKVCGRWSESYTVRDIKF